MERIVMKFGGAALASTEHIQDVAKKVIAEKDSGFDIVVVTTAMSGTSKELAKMACNLSDNASKRELDALLSTS